MNSLLSCLLDFLSPAGVASPPLPFKKGLYLDKRQKKVLENEMNALRPWRDVERMYNEQNPDDRIAAKTAMRIHYIAIEKIKAALGTTEFSDVREDLISALERKEEK